MADVKNPHDRVFRGSMADIQVARPFLEFYLLDETKEDLDLSTLKLLPTSNINQHLDESISDLVYSCQYENEHKSEQKAEARIIILVEHQSSPDRFMPVRVYDYIFGVWCNELKSGSYNKQKLLPACHALVFYHGEQKPYPFSLDLAGCIDDPKNKMETFWQNTIQLVEVDDYSDEQLFEQQLDGVLSLALKHIRDDDLTELIYQITQRLAVIDKTERIELEFIKRLMFYLWSARGNIDKQLLTTKFDNLDGPIGGEVMTFVDELRAEGRKEGLEKGEKTGRFSEKIETAIKCLRKGFQIAVIAELTGLPVERINALAEEHQLH